MTEDEDPARTRAASRAARLAEELRANLAKRKAQARARRSDSVERDEADRQPRNRGPEVTNHDED